MKTAKTKRQRLRALVNGDGIVIAPGCGDALGARLIEKAGFDVCYMSGYAVEATHGTPDVGLLTLSEMAGRAAQICEVTNLPLIADADTGFGNAINVVRMVREYERAGVAAIQLEDQALPKKCGSMPGKAVISTDEMVGKIKAVLDTREDENFQLIARTDICAFEGINAANDRLAAYAEAGADMVLCQGPYTVEEVHDFVGKAQKPVLYLNSESFTMPMMPAHELAQIGVKVVVLPLALTLSAAHAMERTLQVMRETDGDTRAYAPEAMMTWDDCNTLTGFDVIRTMEAKYGTDRV
ncbi:MAG: isocitrate lyase/PEP mutase family protein [Pseudomonadota bacterium]|nr:isocitrate lyase/PEP mutase family protein [Pseudomonadota bacterium]